MKSIEAIRSAYAAEMKSAQSLIDAQARATRDFLIQAGGGELITRASGIVASARPAGVGADIELLQFAAKYKPPSLEKLTAVAKLGLPSRQAAQILGINHQQYIDLLNENKLGQYVNPVGRPEQYTWDDVVRWIKLYQEGESMQSIADNDPLLTDSAHLGRIFNTLGYGNIIRPQGRPKSK
ncbi:MAG: hypothetical protein AAB874_07390 [Patescibacteria group bacterium]